MFLTKMLSFLVILLCARVFGQSSHGQKCDISLQLPCTYVKECIDKLQWCDDKQDCSNGSDERFCDGSFECVPGQFKCKNGRCIPELGRCDGITHCTDRSDEIGCSDNILGTFRSKKLTVVAQAPAQTSYDSHIRQAVAAAADFLLYQREADYGWGTPVSTSRAIVALAFADWIRPLPESEKELMKKQLNIQLSLDLLPNPMTTSLSHQALYVNALYATCQDPRSFQGLDLVSLLRTRTNGEMSKDFSLPLVLLTLCVAGESNAGDIRQLRNIYDASHDRISTQALTLRAWDCMASKRDREYTKYLNEFSSKIANLTDGNLDVYSTALYFQAYNSAVQKSNMSVLMSHRQEDGSFGDLLATYYAIPALLNTTLMQLIQQSCSSPVMHEALTPNTFNMYSGGKNVTYSLWIPTNTYVNTRTITVNFGEKATFYDIMQMAESMDQTYRFMYDTEQNINNRKKIYSLADTPNDAETGKSWTLYRAIGETAVNSLQNLKELELDVDAIIPEGGAHYIFWLKRNEVQMV